jgi:hypothetical protein
MVVSSGGVEQDGAARPDADAHGGQCPFRRAVTQRERGVIAVFSRGHAGLELRAGAQTLITEPVSSS